MTSVGAPLGMDEWTVNCERTRARTERHRENVARMQERRQLEYEVPPAPPNTGPFASVLTTNHFPASPLPQHCTALRAQ
ncbi:hypothetical protein DFH11DRAFT_1723146 [Phellopilus nigrolimitatus]|nr:hypothetical protein DFH11DRAFT_1723146 [Phellopilus nigrolimitatus]